METSSLQQHLSNHGPFGAVLSVMVLLGCFVNYNQTDETVVPSESWCNKTSGVEAFSMPSGLNAVTIIMTLLLPITPLLINSQSKPWNRFKFEMLKTHVVGQGSVFGMAEVMRHVMTWPEPMFLTKCNITSEECNLKSHVKQLPLFVPNNNSFCNVEPSTDIFDSLHHFPDKTCCLIGASVVSFFATLYLWSRANMSGKSIYEADASKKYFLIVLQTLFICCILAYLYFLYITFDAIQLYGILIGGFTQCMIIYATLPKKTHDFEI